MPDWPTGQTLLLFEGVGGGVGVRDGVGGFGGVGGVGAGGSGPSARR